MDETEHALSRCPIDGAPLASLQMGMREATVYEHRDGSRHMHQVDAVAHSVQIEPGYYEVTTPGGSYRGVARPNIAPNLAYVVDALDIAYRANTSGQGEYVGW